ELCLRRPYHPITLTNLGGPRLLSQDGPVLVHSRMRSRTGCPLRTSSVPRVGTNPDFAQLQLSRASARSSQAGRRLPCRESRCRTATSARYLELVAPYT